MTEMMEVDDEQERKRKRQRRGRTGRKSGRESERMSDWESTRSPETKREISVDVITLFHENRKERMEDE